MNMGGQIVKRTERGWAGHFICADRCLFRRNTLLECGGIKIVVSTVGLMVDIHASNNVDKCTMIGCDRYYETMAFYANATDTRYHDADVGREVEFESPWMIDELDADDKANDMHETVVEEIMGKLQQGQITEKGD
jgi:hypothetical protein